MIYVEGGGSTKNLQARCREAFARLLKGCGYREGSFKVVACGPRNEAFKRFRLKFGSSLMDAPVKMWIDSEEPVADIEKTWKHLATRDSSWKKPKGATDEQVLFMTTCMETLIASDRVTLQQHYGSGLKASKLPPLTGIEERSSGVVLEKLHQASGGKYEKGGQSFEIFAKLNPETLKTHLPSFARTRRILDGVLL